MGARIAQLVVHQTHDQKVVGLIPGMSGGRSFFSTLNLLW